MHKLVELTPDKLETVFLDDSVSVSVEIAMKMVIQFWQAKQRPEKQKFVSLKNYYSMRVLFVVAKEMV